ncbi:MAG: A24 family peptidase [Geminicoccaceae bacterium]
MDAICIAFLAGLLVTGALSDIDCRRLPNWLTSAVAILYALFVAVSPTPIDWMSAFLVAGLVFAAGFACFAFQFMGGGDVKLMSGLALWAGIEHIALFLIVTSLAGGLLSLVMIILRRWIRSPALLMLMPLAGLITSRLDRPTSLAGSPSPAGLADDQINESLPYGVAIAAGGFAVIYALLQL